MALSDSEIRDFMSEEKLKIEPFYESSLNPAGYDLRSEKETILMPSESILISTLERVTLSQSLLGVLHLRSSFAREGVVASVALVDPGFSGQLTIMLFNSGKNRIRVEEKERFIQITFFRLVHEAEKAYSGRYQGSRGVVKSMRKNKAEIGASM